MEQISGPDGRTLYRNHRDGKRGSKGPFYTVYVDDRAQTPWGFFCGNCETTDNAVDPMGRIQCNECSNVTRAEEWDAAHE